MAPFKMGFFGVGGAGCNMTNQVAERNFAGDLTVFEADLCHMKVVNRVANKVPIGHSVTLGLGCKGDPEIGKKCIQKERGIILGGLCGLKAWSKKDTPHHIDLEMEEAKTMLSPFKEKLAFFGFGLGGGLGGGGGPEILKISKSLGFRNIVFACLPSKIEKNRVIRGKAALPEVQKYSDSLFLMNFDWLMAGHKNLDFPDSIQLMDKIIGETMHAMGEYCMSNTYSTPGVIDRFFDRKGKVGSFLFEGHFDDSPPDFLSKKKGKRQMVKRSILSGSGGVNEILFLTKEQGIDYPRPKGCSSMIKYALPGIVSGRIGFGF